MWVNDGVRLRLYKFLLFLACLVFVVMFLYFLAYQKWAGGVSSAAETASSTPSVEVATATSSVVSVRVKPQGKPVQQLKLLSAWKSTMTTIFWVGEPADSDNAYITNTESYWDEKWQQHYGGVDSPNCRTLYAPCDFTPKENPFYFALPYADYGADGNLKALDKEVPWYGKDSTQLLKNRWIAVKHAGVTCYAQWEDVGPNGEDDFAYVFGKAAPANTFGEKAGLDSSPALWKCLQMSDNDVTEWAFVDGADVPAGPWKDIVTTSGTSWSD